MSRLEWVEVEGDAFGEDSKREASLSTNLSIGTPKALDKFNISSWLIEVVYPRSQFDITCEDLLIRMPSSFCVRPRSFQ